METVCIQQIQEASSTSYNSSDSSVINDSLSLLSPGTSVFSVHGCGTTVVFPIEKNGEECKQLNN
jgi:hypothetical protein